MNLYEITEQFNAILDDCENMTDDELGNALFEINAEFAEKIQNCVYYIRNQQAHIDGIDAEISRLQERKAVKQRKIDGLKTYMLNGMETMQRPKIEYPEFSVNVQNNPPSVNVVNESLIPSWFIKTKTIETIDKKAIKEAGGCPGAEIVQGKGIRIR